MNAVSTKAALALSVLGAATLALAPATSLASNGQEGLQSITVHIGDLDAHTPQGARRIFIRLDSAAQHICGSDYGALRMIDMPLAFNCEKHVVAPAVEQIDSPQLTAVYLRRFPGREARVLIDGV